ncbi:MAG: mucoidy inhibitor MuiA family protein [Erysipelotrichaceae bacterium]|nr:mucoidy inhibitor MuiA family protein [Erysipelotrichaceae bacterium]
MKGIQTKIKSVRIYRQGADIRRRGKAELAQGENQLLIDGATRNADFSTVRLYFTSPVRMADLRFVYPEDEEKESAVIREKIEDLNKQIETYELQIELWKENGVFTNRQDLDPQQIENYIGELPQRLGALRKNISDANKSIKELEKQLNELQKTEANPLLSVRIYAEKDETAEFEYVYHDDAASWQPVNEIHADPDQPVVLKTRARIFQHTNEDWKDVAVSLLSGTPSANSELPVLNPVYLRIRTASSARAVPRLMAAGSMAKMNAKIADEVADSCEEVDYEAPETEAAFISSEETMTEYQLPGTKDIPKDGDGTMADLQSYTLPCEYEVVAVPKLDTRAYLTAKIKTKDLPIAFSGQAEIYLKEVYAGTAYLYPDTTREELVISLGREEAIQVTRTEKARKSSEAMLINSRNTEYAYELKITNGKNKEETVIVRDQLPVSQDKTITVELLNSDKAEKDEKEGMLTWKLELAPKESKTLSLSYKVSWPKDKNIQETSPSVRKFCRVCGAPVYGSFCPECGAAC